MNKQHDNSSNPVDTKADPPDDSASVLAKLVDAGTPGYQAEFDPAEAEAAGAFREDALSEADALDSTHEAPQSMVGATPQKS